MHNLVPHFILEQLSAGNFSGEFPAVGLFADISGFSAMTEALMHHGQHGAEELATIMRAVFAPMINSIYQQNGFIATLAGDAITGLFPLENSHDEQYLRAVVSARNIQQSIGSHQTYSTKYGEFSISARVGLALGTAEWGIVFSKEGHRAVYFFHGNVIKGCTEAESQSGPGEIIVDPELFEMIKQYVENSPIGDYQAIQRITQELPPIQRLPDTEPNLSAVVNFYPPELINQTYNGEFRQVVNLFINLPTIRTKGQLEIFMRSIFKLQDHYGGLLNRLDFGDKGAHLLMFWGAPVTYENDIERALDFILTLQEETSIPFHAGITYRISHAGFIGSDLREEYTCYGQGVNLAARFMVAAPRGMIWIDEHIAERAEALHEIEFIGEKSFKGFIDKQATYVLYERKDEYTPFFRGEMVGRAAELEQMAAFINPLQDGEFAGVLLVWGEAGIGKSRLVHEFQNSDHPVSRYSLWALCQTDQLLREAFNPFRYWLQQYFGVSETQGEARNKRGFNQKLDLLIAKTEQASLVKELDRTRSFLGALLGLYWPDSLYEESEAQGRYENTLDGLATLFLAESTIQPVIIHLEDAHWLDADSKSFLSHLIGQATNGNSQPYRIAIIATARPENEDGILGEVEPTAEIRLQKFSQDEISDFAERVLSAPAGPGLRVLLSQRADGNPFFIEQILYYLRDQDLLLLHDNGYEAGKLNQSLLPTDARAVLVARLDQLGGEVKELIQIASVLGREFEVPLLAQMVSNGSDLYEKLLEGERGAIWSPLSEDKYIFKHALMQDAAYNMQLQSKRQELHALAVDALEIQYAEDLSSHYGALAYHAQQADDRRRAFSYFLLAAGRAEQNYANDEAINHYTKAIDLVEFVSADALTRATLHRGRGRAYQIQGHFTLARRDYETSHQVAQDAALSQLEWRTLIDLGKLWASRNYYKTHDYFDQALTFARKQSDPELLGGSLNWMGNWYANNENPSESYAYHQEALNIFEQQGNSREIANTLDLLGIAHLLGGDYNASVKYYNRAIPIFRELDNPRRLLNSLLGRGIVLPLVILLAMVPPDPTPDSFRDLCEALDIAREIGSSPDEAMVNWGLGPLHTLIGNYGKGLEISREGIQIASRIGHREWWVGNLLALGIQYGELLAPNRALAQLQQGMEIAEELRSQYWINHLTGAMATAHILQGDLESARRRLDSVLSEGTPMDTKGRRYCWARRAELAFVQGNIAEALELTDRLIDAAAGIGPEKVITFLWLLKGKAFAAIGRTEEAEILLQAAAANAQKTGERFLLWRIHGTLGQLYLTMGQSAKAAHETSTAGRLIEEIAATVSDNELRQNFRQLASETF